MKAPQFHCECDQEKRACGHRGAGSGVMTAYAQLGKMRFPQQSVATVNYSSWSFHRLMARGWLLTPETQFFRTPTQHLKTQGPMEGAESLRATQYGGRTAHLHSRPSDDNTCTDCLCRLCHGSQLSLFTQAYKISGG